MYFVCVYQLVVGGYQIDLAHSAVASRNVRECEDDRIRACTPQTCLNGGTCHILGTSSFQCHCPLGFTGITCNVRKCTCTVVSMHALSQVHLHSVDRLYWRQVQCQ